MQTLRGREALARAELDAGCRADLEKIAHVTEAPLRRARSELESYLSSLGSLESTLASSLRREHAEAVALRCASDAFANAGVRFRARFRNYAESLAVAQRSFIEVITSSDPAQRRRLKAPRQIAVPRVELDNERSIVPQSMPSLSDLDSWIDEVAQHVHCALASTVDAARQKILERGMRDMARTLTAVRLTALTTHA